MIEVRIIDYFSDEASEEIDSIIKGEWPDAVTVMNRIFVNDEGYKALSTIWVHLNMHDRNVFAQDIVDLMTGKAKLAERLYYVKLVDGSDGYLNYQKSFCEYFLNDIDDVEDPDYQTKFTMNEIKNIDERYIPFAIPVEVKHV